MSKIPDFLVSSDITIPLDGLCNPGYTMWRLVMIIPSMLLYKKMTIYIYIVTFFCDQALSTGSEVYCAKCKHFTGFPLQLT